MVILPISPTACAVVTTTMLALTFYVGRWFGIRWMMERLVEEVEKNEGDIW
jgi:hypothetical protein